MHTTQTQKGMALPLIIAGVLVVLVGGYFVMNNQSAAPESPDTMVEDDAMIEDDHDGDTMMKDDVMTDDVMEGDEAMMSDDDAMVKGAGVYTDYKPELLANANDGKVVLFFKANWCPGCRALDSDIEENKDSIPEGVTILRLDYDTETELKKKYGVTTQHTLVQVDAEGNLIAKTAGDSSFEKLLGGLK